MRERRHLITSAIPSYEWLSNYTFGLFGKDVAAGLNVLVILVPQGMAYALLAGVPPIYGLYAGLVPVLVYAIFGTSMHLSIGPAAISSLLLMEGISQVAEPESSDFIRYVLLTGLIVGVLQFLMGITRMGFWIRFLSRPIIIGFTSAAAIIIATSQFKYLFGFNIPRFPLLIQTWRYVLENLSQFNWITFIICISGIAIIYIFKNIHKSIPGGLIAASLAILIMYYFQLESKGVEIVGNLPAGLPSFQLLQFDMEDIKVVMPTSIVLAFLSMVESVSIAKFWANKSKTNYFDANKELIAYGLSKIGGAFFQAIPASGSNSRSAVNFTSGAQTQMSSMVSVIFMGLILLYFSNIFYYLPKAILASIIMLAVAGLFSYREIISLWNIYRPDFWIAIVTFFATIFLGVINGLIIGTLFAGITVLFKTARPKITLLGKMPNSSYYRDISKFPEAITIPNCLLIKFESALYYFNVLHFTNMVEKTIRDSDEQIECLILDVSAISTVDSSGMRTLESLQFFLEDLGISKLYLCGNCDPFIDCFLQNETTEKLEINYQFFTLNDAVHSFQHGNYISA